MLLFISISTSKAKSERKGEKMVHVQFNFPDVKQLVNSV